MRLIEVAFLLSTLPVLLSKLAYAQDAYPTSLQELEQAILVLTSSEVTSLAPFGGAKCEFDYGPAIRKGDNFSIIGIIDCPLPDSRSIEKFYQIVYEQKLFITPVKSFNVSKIDVDRSLAVSSVSRKRYAELIHKLSGGATTSPTAARGAKDPLVSAVDSPFSDPNPPSIVAVANEPPGPVMLIATDTASLAPFDGSRCSFNYGPALRRGDQYSIVGFVDCLVTGQAKPRKFYQILFQDHLFITPVDSFSVPPEELERSLAGRTSELQAQEQERYAKEFKQRNATARTQAIQDVESQLRRSLKSFEVRGLTIGADYYDDMLGITEAKNDLEVDLPPDIDIRTATTADGGKLVFYNKILASVVFEDIQDTDELAAVLLQLEKKFKSRPIKIPTTTRREGNLSVQVGGFAINISDFGLAMILFTNTRPVDRRTCIDDVARDMRLRLSMGLRNYSSLTDRVENECAARVLPTRIAFSQVGMDGLMRSRVQAEKKRQISNAASIKEKELKDKVSKF